MNKSGKPLRLILIEDSPDDAELLILNLVQGGYQPQYQRIETETELVSALASETWDVILCDYLLPHFDALGALKTVQQAALDIPFIVVSGKIGEETAVEAMRLGAHDYIMKNNMKRLCAAVEREIDNAKIRADRRRGIEKIRHLNLILQAIRNVNQLIVREKRREELIRQACELLTETRGFSAAWLAVRKPRTKEIQISQAGLPPEPFARLTEAIQQGRWPLCSQKAMQQESLSVIRKQMDICGDCPLREGYREEVVLTTSLVHQGQHFGCFTVCLAEPFADFEEDQSLFKEIAGDISFALYSIEAEKQRDEAFEIINLSPAVAFLWKNAEGWPVQFVSENVEEVFGYTAEELLSGQVSYASIIHPDDLSRVGEEVAAWSAQHDASSFEHFPYRIVDKHGAIKWLDDRTAIRRDKNGNITHFQGVVLDVTERQKAEEALRSSNRILDATGAIAKTGGWEHDLITGKAIWTKALYDIIEIPYNKEPPGVAEHLSYYPPRDREILMAAYNEAIANGRPFDLELQVNTANNNLLWCRVQGEPVYQNGKCVSMRGTFKNITERKLAEETVRETNARYRLLADNSTDVIWVLGLDMHLIYLSPSITPLTGFTIDEMQKAMIYDYVDPEHAAEFATLFATELQKPKEERQRSVQQEYKLLRKDGSYLDVELHANWMYDDTGELIGVLGISRDISERRRAEKALRESEEKHRTYVENAPDGIFIVDAEGKHVDVNKTACQMTGYSPEELRTMGIADLASPQAAAELLPTMHRLKEAKHLQTEVVLRKKDGSEMIASLKAVALNDDRYMAFCSDITALKHEEEERLRLEAQLRQQQKLESIGTLASGVAHEINNPITAILNLSEIIQIRVKNDAKLQDYTRRIINETNRISKIVKNLLSFARQEKEHHSPAFLSDIIDDTLQLIAAVFRRDNITVQIDIPENLPKIKCRSHQIQQVIMNLLTNARDALNERYPEYDENKSVIISVRPFERDGQPWLRTTVEDRGVGIEPQIAEKIFDPFFTTKGREKGTGLGLSISHGIIREHGGLLRVESKVREYTRFHMELRVNSNWNLESTIIT